MPVNSQVYQVIPYSVFKSFLEDNDKSFDDIVQNSGNLLSYISAHGITESNNTDSTVKNACSSTETYDDRDLTENNVKHNNAFSCNICNRALNSKWSLGLHKRLHTSERPFSCENCGSSFTKEKSLARHKRMHLSPCSKEIINNTKNNVLSTHDSVSTRHCCDVCGLQLSSRCRLMSHRKLHTGERPYMCHICNSAFSRIDQLKNHIRSHNPEKLYTCEFCGQKLSTRKSLECHGKIHAKEKSLKLNVNKDVTSTENTDSEIPTSNGDRPYLCTVCFASFKQSSALNSHLKIHMDERPYRCQFCGLSFKRKDCMISHERMHTGEKPFPCQYCGLRFSRRSSKISHELIHTGEKPYSCGICKRAFRLSAALKNHTCVPRVSALTICDGEISSTNITNHIET